MQLATQTPLGIQSHLTGAACSTPSPAKCGVVNRLTNLHTAPQKLYSQSPKKYAKKNTNEHITRSLPGRFIFDLAPSEATLRQKLPAVVSSIAF